MGRRLENLEQFGIDVVLDVVMAFAPRFCEESFMPFPLSTIVSCNSGFIFTGNEFFASERLGLLVISMGNLTVGGTGKTPIVEKIARALQTADVGWRF